MAVQGVLEAVDGRTGREQACFLPLWLATTLGCVAVDGVPKCVVPSRPVASARAYLGVVSPPIHHKTAAGAKAVGFKYRRAHSALKRYSKKRSVELAAVVCWGRSEPSARARKAAQRSVGKERRILLVFAEQAVH